MKPTRPEADSAPSNAPTTPSKPARRPASFRMGRIGVHVIRGPNDEKKHYWQATATFGDGKRQTVWSGWATRPEAEEAVARARANLGDMSLSGLPKVPLGGLTVAALLDLWLEDVSTRPWLSPTTQTKFPHIARRLKERLGALPVETISVAHTGRYMADRQNRDGVAMRTAHGELCVLRSAWRWGLAARLHREPLHLPAVRLPPVHRPRPTAEGAWLVYDDMVASGVPEAVRRVFAMGLITGARTGEILQLRVGDIDIDARRVTIRTGKTGARVVYLAEAAVAVIQPELEGRDPNDRYHGSQQPTTVGKILGRYIRLSCRRLRMQEFTMYGLRRLAVDEYQRAGCPAAVAGAQLGHTPEVATRVYRQVRRDEQAKVVQVAQIGVRPTHLPVSPPPPQVSSASALRAAGSTGANRPAPGTNPAGASKSKPGVLDRAERVRRIEADKTIKISFGGSR